MSGTSQACFGSASQFLGGASQSSRELPIPLGAEALAELRAMLRDLVTPVAVGEKVVDLIDRAARRSGLSFTRTSDIWYNKARKTDQREFASVAAALEEKRALDVSRELLELRARLERLESLLVQKDPDFHRPTIDQVREQARRLGGGGRPLAAPADVLTVRRLPKGGRL